MPVEWYIILVIDPNDILMNFNRPLRRRDGNSYEPWWTLTLMLITRHTRG